MDSERKEYTFLWFIENYSYCWHKNGEVLISPRFTSDLQEGVPWTLKLYPRGWNFLYKGNVSVFLNRNETDDGPESISSSYDLSVLAADGSTLFSSPQILFALAKGSGYGCGRFLEMDEILLRRKADFLPQDILTLRCKVCKGDGKVRNIGQGSARTRIKIEKISFLHEVEGFSTLEPNVKQTIKIQSHSDDESYISCSVYFTEGSCCEQKIMIEIIPSDSNQLLWICELCILAESGREVECGKADCRHDIEGKSIRTLPLSLTRKKIMKRKSEYLPNDKLSLTCKCSFSAGIQFQTIEETVYKTPLPALKQEKYHPKIVYKAAEKLSSYPSALEDMKTLYTNQSLTDLQLKTKAKSFPAHKSVLCARSPVFKAMMINNMKEKNTDCIEVDDLREDVVQQLLIFLYSDTIENLQWEMATQLYYAADKYQIGKLKAVCSCFLVDNLTPNNSGELLLLADTHSDTDLKKVVEDFILEHEEQVFGSDEWEKLMETNPLIVMKAMHLKYKRKKESK